MEKIEQKRVLNLARGFQQGDIITISEAAYELGVTREQIKRAPTKPEYLKKPELEILHLKKLDLIRQRLRVELGKIAVQKNLLREGGPVPTAEGYTLRSVAPDGTLLVEEKGTRKATFIDPLSEDFISHLKSMAA